MAITIGAYAQKSYVYMYVSGYDIVLSGDIPNGFTKRYKTNEYSKGAMLNLLSEQGFEVEFMPDSSTFLLSKKRSGSSSAVRRIKMTTTLMFMKLLDTIFRAFQSARTKRVFKSLYIQTTQPRQL